MDQRSVLELKSAIDNVLAHRAAIAVVLASVAETFSGVERYRLRRLSAHFAKSIAAYDVIKDADALTICYSVSQAINHHSGSSGWIEEGTRRGISQLKIQSSHRRRLLKLLIYPAALLLVSVVILIGFGLYLVPQFEAMFIEFDLRIEGTTKWIIVISQWLRQIGLTALLVIVAAGIIAWSAAGILRRQERLPTWINSFPGRFRLFSNPWADWAWHVALLLEVGLSQTDAAEIASRSVGGGLLSAAGPSQYTYPFLHESLLQENREFRIVFLREAATLYWQRDSNRGRWWLTWLPPITTTLIGATVAVVLKALFDPLISLIGGLS